jgi:hypothetical protein
MLIKKRFFVFPNPLECVFSLTPSILISLSFKQMNGMFDSVYVTFLRGTHLNFCPDNVVCGSSNHLNTPLAFLSSQLDNNFAFLSIFRLVVSFVVCVL